MNSGTHKRHGSDGYCGDESIPVVALGNCMAARFALLAMTAVVRGLYWIVPRLYTYILNFETHQTFPQQVLKGKILSRPHHPEKILSFAGSRT